MTQSFNDLFFNILSIINYHKKEDFVKEFEEMNYVEAMMNCIERLPKHIQTEVIARIAAPEEFKKYIPQEIYQQEVTKVSAEALMDFLSYTKSVLSQEQKEKIVTLLSA